MNALKALLRNCSLGMIVSLMSSTSLAAARDLGSETLEPSNGWASLNGGVTGGASATPEQIFVVTNRAELIAALNNGVPSSTSPSNPSNAPKIIYVQGSIDANVNDANQPLTCADYYRNGYTLEAYLAAYDPVVWGRVTPTGPLEAARIASRNAQQARVRIRPGSNTTIVGLGAGAVIKGAWFDIRGTAGVANSRSNIIVRNITFRDIYDCFPEWSPNDGAAGAWNAQYDAISLRDTNNVWIDHNTFEDVETRDETQPNYFGVLYQRHDGLLDITNASDLVTVSWNRFRHHDKVMLIGSSDSATADRGKLRVTLHHNVFENVNQRAPRVRFGQVHLYNNYYDVENSPRYQYSWGVGIESAIYAEANLFKVDADFAAERVLAVFRGTALTATSNHFDGLRGRNPTDVVAAWNEANDPDLGFNAGWVPTLDLGLQPARASVLARLFAGPQDW